MARRTAVVAALATALVLVGSAAGDNSQKIEQLHERIAAAHQREAALNSQIADVTTKIRSLERQVGDVSQRLTILERDLALHQQRLAKLNELFVFETKRLHFLQSQYRAAVTELNRRLVQLYESPNPSVAEVILDSGSVQEAIDTLHYLSAIAAQDQRIARAVAAARNDVHATRERTKKVRAVVASETHIVAISCLRRNIGCRVRAAAKRARSRRRRSSSSNGSRKRTTSPPRTRACVRSSRRRRRTRRPPRRRAA
jgi:predicted  nucleic acid-binding Zn-ribbon protein